jgi:hypothetical protein
MAGIARLMDKLETEADRRSVAYEVWRTYGGPLTDAQRAARYRENRRHETVTMESQIPSRNRDAPGGEIVTNGVTDPILSKALEGFSEFWSVYPKRVGKGEAARTWEKKKCSGIKAEILSAVEKQRGFLEREGGKYTPNPATWLNQRRWEDEPPVNGLVLAPKTHTMIEAAKGWIGGGQ